MIQTRELIKVFRTDEEETTALKKVDLEVKSGEFVAVMGPSGIPDSANGEEVMNLLTELNREGTTMIMVTHSPGDAEKAHRIVQLFGGHLVTQNITKIL
jgi:ABC-type lipoprotein export system ATPase subunit